MKSPVPCSVHADIFPCSIFISIYIYIYILLIRQFYIVFGDDVFYLMWGLYFIVIY